MEVFAGTRTVGIGTEVWRVSEMIGQKWIKEVVGTACRALIGLQKLPARAKDLVMLV